MNRQTPIHQDNLKQQGKEWFHVYSISIQVNNEWS